MLGVMPHWRGSDGQAAVELVALLPLAVLLVAGAWQLAVAGHATWAASSAARAAARAAAVGDDPRAAARRELPHALEPGARIRDRGDGTVAVTVPLPRVLGLPPLGHASATAHFRPQR
jgi:Flp pilus assembly protein TadG